MDNNGNIIRNVGHDEEELGVLLVQVRHSLWEEAPPLSIGVGLQGVEESIVQTRQFTKLLCHSSTRHCHLTFAEFIST